MSRLTPQSWQTLRKVFEAEGYRTARIAGSHLILTRPGSPRPVVIPMYEQVGVRVILNNLRTAGISRDRYRWLLEKL